MTELPLLEFYTPDQRAEIAQAWPATARYLGLLDIPTHDWTNQIRQTRHRAWLRTTFAIFFEKASTEEICRFWSEATSQIISETWNRLFSSSVPIAVFALGKLGAEELNLSSDVDLIFVRQDNSTIALSDVKKFVDVLSHHSDFGFAFRVDTALRPGGNAATLVPSTSDFAHYYGYHGEMWERLAQVRLRPLAGHPEVIKEVMEFSNRFSFRKHLDYTLLNDLKDLRRKVRSEYYSRSPDEFHLKLGMGGIREVELFVHSLQVIHGGRNVRLQTHSTTRALEELKALQLLPEPDANLLLRAYWLFRDVENRIQACEDQQSYLIKWSRPPSKVSSEELQVIRDISQQVSQLVSSLLGEGEPAPNNELPEKLSDQQSWLANLGFSKTSVDDVWPQLAETTAISRRSAVDENERRRFLSDFVHRLKDRGQDHDLGLSILLDFVRAIRAKASFFTLLNRETRIRDDLAYLFSCSPYLGQILASRPELLDAYILGRHESSETDLESVLDSLAERRLLSELLASSRFLSDRDLDMLTANLSRTANEIVQEVLRRADPNKKLDVVCMGKWGGQELGLRSDLDFIFVCKDEPSQEDQKLARKVLTLLTQPTRAGVIYPVDLRLRPSGQSGPILLKECKVTEYLKSQAAAWERQSYLRARRIDGTFLDASKVGAERGLNPSDLLELKMIREKLFKSDPGVLDLKLNPGGLSYVEFNVQISLLRLRVFPLETSTLGMIQYLEKTGEAWRSCASRTAKNYRYLREVEQLHQLVTSQSGSKITIKSPEMRRLSRLQNCDEQQLERDLRSIMQENVELMSTVDPLL